MNESEEPVLKILYIHVVLMLNICKAKGSNGIVLF